MKKILILSIITLMIFPILIENANAGSSQFLWKPVSESNGKLVVLLPCKYKISDVKTILVKYKNRTDNPTSITGPANGDRTHARFPRAGRDYGNGPTVIAVLKSGKKFSWTIPSGAKRFESMNQGKPAGKGSLDDVIGVTPDKPVKPGDSNGSDKKSSGEDQYRITKDGTVNITACLATYGQAQLNVKIKTGDKEKIVMKWERNSDRDTSPLLLNGKEISDSMFEENPGDFSAKPYTAKIKVKKGDIITLSLSGDYGRATPVLKLEGKIAEKIK